MPCCLTSGICHVPANRCADSGRTAQLIGNAIAGIGGLYSMSIDTEAATVARQDRRATVSCGQLSVNLRIA